MHRFYKYYGALHLKSLMLPFSTNIAVRCTWKSFDVAFSTNIAVRCTWKSFDLASVYKYCGALHLEIV
jgi:hypothetical protein